MTETTLNETDFCLSSHTRAHTRILILMSQYLHIYGVFEDANTHPCRGNWLLFFRAPLGGVPVIVWKTGL